MEHEFLQYLRESCLCTRISGVEGVLLDWVRLSFRWESCAERPDFSRQTSSGGSISLAGLLDDEEKGVKISVTGLNSRWQCHGYHDSSDLD